MELGTILLIFVLVLELGIGVGAYFLWRQGRSGLEAREDTFKVIVQTEMGRLEHYLDGKVDLLRAQLADLQTAGAEGLDPILFT